MTKLVKEEGVPEFQDGYDQWRKDCGSVYAAEAIAAGEYIFRENLGGPAAKA